MGIHPKQNKQHKTFFGIPLNRQYKVELKTEIIWFSQSFFYFTSCFHFKKNGEQNYHCKYWSWAYLIFGPTQNFK